MQNIDPDTFARWKNVSRRVYAGGIGENFWRIKDCHRGRCSDLKFLSAHVPFRSEASELSVPQLRPKLVMRWHGEVHDIGSI